MMQSAYFATACDKQSETLAIYLSKFLDELGDNEDIGVNPYQIPRRLIDPKFACKMSLRMDFSSDLLSFRFDFRTGDLLTEPVFVDKGPSSRLAVSRESSEWFEAQPSWPKGSLAPSISHFANVVQVRDAVAEWVWVASLSMAVVD
jgi:hypothetical protein